MEKIIHINLLYPAWKYKVNNIRTYLACPDYIIPEKQGILIKCVWQDGTVIVGQLLRHQH